MSFIAKEKEQKGCYTFYNLFFKLNLMRENIYGYFKIVIKLLCSSNCLWVGKLYEKKAESTEKSWVEQAVENARCQIGLEIDTIEASGKVLNPVTLNENEQVYYCGVSDWRSGFFPRKCVVFV